MAWRPTPRGLRTEFDEMLADMQRQFTEMMGRISAAAQQVPLLGGAGTLLDIREHEDEVVVVADLPGVEREMISVRLIDPRTLRISARREEALETEQAGYYMRERRLGTISRTATLPTDVTEEGAQATFKNGVLEVRLKKVAEARGKEIAVSSEPQLPGRSFAEEQKQREMERSRGVMKEAEAQKSPGE
jgi:HSP20 family protein